MDPTKVTVQTFNDSSSVTLTGGTVVTFQATMVLRLLREDAAVIKLDPYLAKNLSTSYLSISYHAFADTAGNFLSAIPETFPLHVTTYRSDTVPPALIRFVKRYTPFCSNLHSTLPFFSIIRI